MSDTSKIEKIIIGIAQCLTVVATVFIISYTHYSIEDRKLMSENIQRSIDKEINPLSIRCSYAPATDIICVAYGNAINVNRQVQNQLNQNNQPNNRK